MLGFYLIVWKQIKRRQCTSGKVSIRKCKHTALTLYTSKCVCIITFIFSTGLDPSGKTILSTGQEISKISTCLFKLHVTANIFSVLLHSRRLKSLLIFCFDILNLKLFNFQITEGKENM